MNRRPSLEPEDGIPFLDRPWESKAHEQCWIDGSYCGMAHSVEARKDKSRADTIVFLDECVEKTSRWRSCGKPRTSEARTWTLLRKEPSCSERGSCPVSTIWMSIKARSVKTGKNSNDNENENCSLGASRLVAGLECIIPVDETTKRRRSGDVLDYHSRWKKEKL